MAAARGLWASGLARVAAVARRGLAGRGAASLGPDGREPDPDLDWEPEERELQEVASALRRRAAAIRLQKARRQLQPRGAPARTLPREAMEQIRYLHKEFEETWPLPRLAEGFDVSVDVIRRVLKSKFVPTPGQKRKDPSEEQKAMKEQRGQQPRGSGDRLTTRRWVAASWSVPGGEFPAKDQVQSWALKGVKLRTQGAGAPKSRKGGNKGAQSPRSCAPAQEAPTGHQRPLHQRSRSMSQTPT